MPAQRSKGPTRIHHLRDAKRSPILLRTRARWSQGMAHAALATDSVPNAQPIKVGINGFGRIGRQLVRILVDRYPAYEIRHINSTRALAVAVHIGYSSPLMAIVCVARPEQNRRTT